MFEMSVLEEKRKVYLWKLYPLLNKNVAAPGENIQVTLYIENPNNFYIYISEVLIEIPQANLYWKLNTQIQRPPFTRYFLASANLQLPINLIGHQFLRFKLSTWQFDSIEQKWKYLGLIETDGYHQFWMLPTPRYRAFVSRSNRNYDKPIVEPVVRMIQEWGFETFTVEINIFEKEPFKLPYQIKEEIIKADCLIAIATPRDLSALDGMWKTLTWLDNEVALAFGHKKPILLITDIILKLEGLISLPVLPLVQFSPFDMGKLYFDLCDVMPHFREWIRTHKEKEFYSALLDFIGKASVGFLAGYLFKEEN